MTSKLIFTAEELEAVPAYTPFVGFTRKFVLDGEETWGRILFWRTPNGSWWVAGEGGWRSAEWILGVSAGGVTVLDAPVPPAIAKMDEEDADLLVSYDDDTEEAPAPAVDGSEDKPEREYEHKALVDILANADTSTEDIIEILTSKAPHRCLFNPELQYRIAHALRGNPSYTQDVHEEVLRILNALWWGDDPKDYSEMRRFLEDTVGLP